jgi:hypothetical protein
MHMSLRIQTRVVESLFRADMFVPQIKKFLKSLSAETVPSFVLLEDCVASSHVLNQLRERRIHRVLCGPIGVNFKINHRDTRHRRAFVFVCFDYFDTLNLKVNQLLKVLPQRGLAFYVSVDI